MEPHQERVVEEKFHLDEKLRALETFTGTEIFKGLPADEQSRMNRQVGAMDSYSQILGERISAF